MVVPAPRHFGTLPRSTASFRQRSARAEPTHLSTRHPRAGGDCRMPFLVRGEKSAHVFSTHLSSYRWLELMQGLSPRRGAPSWKLNLFAEGKAAVDYVASWFSYICPDYIALRRYLAPSSQPWHGRILLLNHTRLKWCPQPDWLPKPCNMGAPSWAIRYRELQSHQQPGV